MTPVALTVAGSDPTSGAGMQADLRAFVAHGVWGCAVPAVITVQSTRGVVRAIPVDASLVGEQLDVLVGDVRVTAWKTGALGTRENVEAVAARAAVLAVPLVVDPVLVASSGAVLLDEGARGALVASLFPRAALVTPNAPEAALLTGRRVETVDEARDAARALLDLGARAVLLKGGHLRGERLDVAVDVLAVSSDGAVTLLAGPRLTLSRRAHGTGCLLSAAITARLARGEPLAAACDGAKAWLARALATPVDVGEGDALLALPDARL